jgi:3-phenylpropionate/cinnamic acid dioxygenase small subunit
MAKYSNAELSDRLEIRELLDRYAAVVDERRWDALLEVFTPDAQVDYTSTGGKSGALRPVMEWLARALAPWPLNLHFVTNAAIELAGDRARSRCYFQAPMGRVLPDGTQEIITNAGWYDDELVRTPAGWRIARRVCTQTMMLGRLPSGYEIPD